MADWQSEFLVRFSQRAKEAAHVFRSAAPFPHAVFDNLFSADVMRTMLHEFPPPDASIWQRSNDAAVQVKLRTDWKTESDIPPGIRDVVHLLNSGAFMNSLSELTGIGMLISDPYYTGGGLNCTLPGGLLEVHCDGNWHHAMGVHRRLNVILYLNESWEEEWGGALELWDRNLTACQKSIAPAHNRLVVFETHDYTYHGHPQPLRCPEGQSRRSLILYYYTAQPRPQEQVMESGPHRALWRGLNFRPLP